LTITKEQRKVHITVKGKTETENGWTISSDIPEFKSKFPFPLTRVSNFLAGRLVVGGTYAVLLEQGNLKQGREGTYATDFFWNLRKLADEDAPVEEHGEQASGRAGPPPDRQDLIMLQHASGVVAQAYGDWNRLPPGTRGTFPDYLKAIAQGATWLLHNHYQVGGYRAQKAGGDEPADERDDVPF